MRSMRLRSEEWGLNPLRWPKQTEELVESIEKLDELSQFVLILNRVELDESEEGLGELTRIIATTRSNGTR